MPIIDELLQTIPDKFQNRNTTSHRFKRDLFDFFNKPEFKDKHCVEWGSHIGYTTKVMSYLFNTVTGFNHSRTVEAEEFNKDRPNVKFYGMDIYTSEIPINTGDVFLVDAVHTYDAVVDDTMRSLNFRSAGKKYLIYDDYGAFPEIRKGIHDLISLDKIRIIKKIGYAPTETFTHTLYDYEGLICEEVVSTNE